MQDRTSRAWCDEPHAYEFLDGFPEEARSVVAHLFHFAAYRAGSVAAVLDGVRSELRRRCSQRALWRDDAGLKRARLLLVMVTEQLDDQPMHAEQLAEAALEWEAPPVLREPRARQSKALLRGTRR